MLFAQWVTSQLVTANTTVTFFSHTGVLGPSRIVRKHLASSIVHSALEHVCVVSHSCILRLRRLHHGRIHGKIGIHGGGILQSLTRIVSDIF